MAAKPFKRDEFLRMLNKYKPKPDSPRAGTDTTPQQIRTVPATSQSAGPPASHLPSTSTSSHLQTAPVTHSKPFSSTPVPYNSSYSDSPAPAKSADKPSIDMSHITPTTNRRASISAVASPYNLIPLNNSFGMPVIHDDEDFSSTPAYKSQTPPYPSTPSPSVTRTPWPSTTRRTSTSKISTIEESTPSRESSTALVTSTPSPRVGSRTPSPERPTPAAPSSSLSHDSEAEHSHAIRILVADNSQNDRQIYKRMLSQYQADIVGSGTGALDLFDTNNYDVILLDCNLEGIHTS